MRMTPVGLAAVGTFAMVACGGGDGPTTVTPVPSSVAVSLSATGPVVSFGDTRTLTAVVKDASGTVLPSATVTWTVDNASVTLSPTSGASTTATAAANGTATITATSGSASGTTQLVVAQKFAALTLAPAPATVSVGGTQQLTATARDARGGAIAGATGFTYASSDQTKATVSTSGLVSGVAAGTSTITAALTRDGVTANGTSVVTVSGSAGFPSSALVVAGTDLLFTPNRVDIAAGGTVTYRFQATAHNVFYDVVTGAPTTVPTTSNGDVDRTFPTAGTFPYSCHIHAGMTGTVVVH